MPKEQAAGKPTTRRYSSEEKATAVRMVRTLRAELGATQGTVQRVATELEYGVESVRMWVKQADIDDGVAPGVRRSRLGCGSWSKRSGSCAGPTRCSSGPRLSSGRSSTATTGSSRVRRREQGRPGGRSPARGRAHLQTAAGGPEQLLRRQDPHPVRASGAGRGAYSAARRALGEQLPCLRGPQAVEGRPPRGHGDRSRSNGPVDARRRDRGRETVEAGEDHSPGSDLGAASGSGAPGVHRDRPEPAVGDRSDVRADVGRCGVRVLHHRRVQSHDRGLAGRVAYAHRDGARRDRDGPLVPRSPSRRPAVSFRCGQSRRIQLVVATPRDRGGVRVVRRQQAADRAVRPRLRSPGHPKFQRPVERAFWVEIARGLLPHRGGCSCRSVAAGWAAVVPQRWRHATIRSEVEAVGPAPVVRGA